MPFQFAFSCIDTVYVWGHVSVQYLVFHWLDFQRARALHLGLCKMYCTVSFSYCVKPQSLWAYRGMYLSVLLSLIKDLFLRVSIFAKPLLKEQIHFTSRATGLWFNKMLVFSSSGMDVPVFSFVFCCHDTQHLTCHTLYCSLLLWGSIPNIKHQTSYAYYYLQMTIQSINTNMYYIKALKIPYSIHLHTMLTGQIGVSKCAIL